MKASELRIGNYVKIDGVEKPMKVLILDSLEVSLTPFLPIPLTEEWLLKFRFEKHKDFFFIEWNEFSFSIHEYEDGKFIITNSFNYVDIIHVHQLQNLYFALTNEELTFKSE